MSLTLSLTPRKAALVAGHDNTLDVLVRAVAPPAPEVSAPRKRLNLALVIDRSGSMSGPPLAEAKRCAAAIVDRLTAEDYVAVVAYDQAAAVVYGATPAANPAGVKAAIASIHEGGTTALHDGWAAGAEQAAVHVARADVSRVLLLSDGCANVGLSEPHEIAAHCAQMAAKGVGTSTYGLGGHFNEALMIAMARAGGGNGYYGQTAADLMGPFQQEFDLLKALYARGPLLELAAPAGVGVEVANDLARVGAAWRLPDVAYGAEAWAIVRLRVPAAMAVEAGEIELLTASLRYEAATSAPTRLALAAMPASAFAQLAEDELVARRAQEVSFAAHQRDAAAAARIGDWSRVETVLQCARREAAGNAWLTNSLRALEEYAAMRDREKLAKESTYKAARMMTRLAARDETPVYAAMSEAALPSFLRRRSEEGRRSEPRKD